MRLWLLRTFYQIWLVRAETEEAARKIVDPKSRIPHEDIQFKEILPEGKPEVLLKV